MTKQTKKKEYNADSVQHYEGLAGIRKRPTMYISSIGLDGIFHLYREAIDNSIDEFEEGYCTEIQVIINEVAKTIQIIDNGRGIPIEKIKLLMEKLHSGGKFNSDSYKFSSGINGVGLKCINALCDHVKLTVERDGKKVETEYSKGECIKEITTVGKSKNTGTSIIFKPDVTIFKDDEITYERYMEHCENTSYLNKGLIINFIATTRDGRNVNKKFKSNEGLIDLLRKTESNLITQPIIFTMKREDMELSKLEEDSNDNPDLDYQVTIAIAYSHTDEEKIVSFCNSVPSIQGGSHVTGLKMGLSTVIPQFIKTNKMLTKKDENLEITGDDVREGLVAIICAKHTDPIYDSQSKDKINNTELTSIARKAVFDHFKKYLEENKTEAKHIAQKVILNAKSRTASKKVKELNKISQSSINLGAITKFVDCANNYPDYRELFIVEGSLNCSL